MPQRCFYQLSAAGDPLKNHIEYSSNCASEGWDVGHLFTH